MGADDSLAHFTSPYYDPQKAHDYYLRTRQLVAKNSLTALTSTAQRDIFAVSKSNITAAKTSDTIKAQNVEQAHLAALSKTAKDTAIRINATLQALNAKINFTNSKNQTAASKKPVLNVIPSNATPAQRTFLTKQNNILTAAAAKINQANSASINGQSHRDLAAANTQAVKDRQKVATDLTAAVNTARANYATQMAALQTKYQTILATEQQNIRNQVSGVNPKALVKTHGNKIVPKHSRTKKH